MKYTFEKSLCIFLLGRTSQWHGEIPRALPAVCGAHVFCQSPVLVWLSLLVGG